MSNISSIITSLNSKIEKLILLHRQAEEEKLQLLSERDDLLTIIRELKHKQEILEQSLVSGSRPMNGDWAEVHRRIDAFIAEIDELLARPKT